MSMSILIKYLYLDIFGTFRFHQWQNMLALRPFQWKWSFHNSIEIVTEMWVANFALLTNEKFIIVRLMHEVYTNASRSMRCFVAYNIFPIEIFDRLHALNDEMIIFAWNEEVKLIFSLLRIFRNNSQRILFNSYGMLVVEWMKMCVPSKPYVKKIRHKANLCRFIMIIACVHPIPYGGSFHFIFSDNFSYSLFGHFGLRYCSTHSNLSDMLIGTFYGIFAHKPQQQRIVEYAKIWIHFFTRHKTFCEKALGKWQNKNIYR